MAELVSDCPRCGSKKITFELKSYHLIGQKYNWQDWYEVFCVCRNCVKTTTFYLSLKDSNVREYIYKKGLLSLEKSINNYFNVEGYVTNKDFSKTPPPEHLPSEIMAAFEEGAICMAVNCFNASATMFRLCIDHATTSLLPIEDSNGLNKDIRRSLGRRIKWLLDNNILPEALRELSICVKEDGNDAAHAGTITNREAEDLLDFTCVLLERLYTEPERLRLAKERREHRRRANT